MNERNAARLEALCKRRWQGYARTDGIGIRNKVLIIYTVECASFVAQEIARKVGSPDVDVVGFAGCCDSQYAVRLLISLLRHPNVGALLAVGLGCEYTRPHALRDLALRDGKPADSFYIQENGGTTPSVEKGIAIVESFLRSLERTPRTEMTVRDLVIGAECGGSDYTSGLAGNACVGRFYDCLVDAGGTAIFEEIMEAVGLKDYLVSRCGSARLKAEMAFTYDKMMDHCRHIRQFGISPGNFKGGITTIEEKSMGSLAKSGTREVSGILKVSQPARNKGLFMLDSTPDPYYMGFGKTNPNDSEGLMALISNGSHLVFLVTGRGSVVGSAVAPTYKITGNHVTYGTMRGDMDFDASPVLDGQKSMDELALDLFEDVLAVCAGKETCAERLGHKEYCIPYKYQQKGCVALDSREEGGQPE